MDVETWIKLLDLATIFSTRISCLELKALAPDIVVLGPYGNSSRDLSFSGICKVPDSQSREVEARIGIFLIGARGTDFQSP